MARESGAFRLHFLGICGTAMAGVAAELHRRGAAVSGSDDAVYPPMSTFLDEAGVPVAAGYREENLRPAPDLVVVGNAISRGNPELEAALDGGLPYCSLPELLRWAFLPGRTSLVVTGTHGKTTTAALCAWALESSGRAPSWLVGGVPAGLPGGFHLGEGTPFVLEGDEYDTAFFDKRSKFLHYRPQILVLNNVEFDHADIFDDLEGIRRSFRHLLRTVPRSGRVIANWDDPEVRALAALAPCPVVRYSRSDERVEWRGQASPGRVRVRGPGGRTVDLAHDLLGSHQTWNLLAATAALAELGLSDRELETAVAMFPGVRRRGELRGEAAGVRVYDDFAHHPTAIRGVLEGFRERYPGRRLWAVAEPRSNTMRRRVFQEALAGAFGAADRVCLREVPDPGKVPEGERLDVERLAAELSRSGVPARAFPSAGEIVGHLVCCLEPGDVVAVLSNGSFEGIHDRLLEALGSR
ncbi:MAG: UDP-N-acetylmuramate:L-alanyl-gamma-D-glutamyl-meso-diaminopimelate ligase [Deferrisomatales bacterium]|nr:UDP-N-acetylmuramate:L-alanyl-gamma-D-glutamyl-meso-diaminopimelate ligase [Deferrisomatales bacterium]